MIGKKIKKAAMQLMVGVSLLILCFSFGHAADVTLTVEDATGLLPGSTDTQVEVDLDNPDDKVVSIQMDVCDADDFLTCTECDLTVRTEGFDCSSFELLDGCCRIILIDTSTGGFIDTGSGPVVTLTYSASPSAPDECRNHNLENVAMPSCIDDGDGSEGCTGGPVLTNVVLQSGQYCFDSIPSTTTTVLDTTTTPTTSPTTAPTTAPTTIPSTTSTVAPLYEVSISPSLATLDSGATLQFSARTTDNGEEVEGTYVWEIAPVSAIGSAIDGDGLFAAGENAAAASIEETVKVTDTAHQNKSATATVTIKVKEPPLPGCEEVRINPAPVTVASGDMLTFTAQTVGDDCETSDFDWSVDSDIGSAIDGEGNYAAGSNKTESPVADTVTVVDRANGDLSADATINVEAEEVQKTVTVLPDTLFGSRWIPLPYLLLISGENVVFDLSSTISFEPGKDIFGLGGLGFGDIFLALILLGANPDEGTVAVSISAGGEVVSGEITIGLFPAPFSE